MKYQMFPRAGFLQFEIRFGSPSDNLETVNSLIGRLQPEADTILVLPELWASGFDYSNAADHAGQTPAILEQLTDITRRYRIFIAGSLLEADRENPALLYNSLYVTGPEGVTGKFQKQHLFSHWQEDEYFQPGKYCPPVQLSGGLVGGLVCYDLRFPEIVRNQVCGGATLVVVSAQWPAVRRDHWRILLQARAIENQVFIVASNGCGRTDSIDMAGHSMILAPDGSILAEAGDTEEASSVALAGEAIHYVRERFCTAGERPRPLQDSEKIVSWHQLQSRLTPMRRQGGRVAFTNGCFDILHSGHVSYLEKARQTADFLVVGLNSDTSVRAIKGSGRPVNNENERARVLAALGCVDFVVLFEEETPLQLIQTIVPDVLIKGADWPEDKIVGAAEVRSAGGRVVRIAFDHDISTSDVISRVRQSHSVAKKQ